MQLDGEGLADPTCVVFSYLLPRDQAALRSTSTTFVQRFNRAVWYRCGIPYAGCQTVFETLEEAEEATDCRWAPVSPYPYHKRADIDESSAGTLVIDLSRMLTTHPGGADGFQLLSRPEEQSLLLFKSIIVLPSKSAASSIRHIKLLIGAADATRSNAVATQNLDLRAFGHVEKLMSGSLTLLRSSSLDFINHLPRLVSIGDDFASSSRALSEVHLCNLPHLESIGSFALGGSPTLEKVVVENLPRLKTLGKRFCSSCDSLIVFSAKGLPKLEEIGREMLIHCTALASVSFAGCPNLRSIGDFFLYGSGGPSLMVDLGGLPSLSAAPNQILYVSYVRHLQFIASPNMTTIGNGFLAYCNRLEDVKFTNTEQVMQVGSQWMRQCAHLEAVSFDTFCSLTSVGSDWLLLANRLIRVDLSPMKNLQAIGDSSFNACWALKECSLHGLANLTTIGTGFLTSAAPTGCTLDVRGCTALTSMGIAVDDVRYRRLKAIKGAKDLPPPVRALLEESVVRRSCCCAAM